MDIFDEIDNSSASKKKDIFDSIDVDKRDIFDDVTETRKPANVMAQDMMSQIAGLDRQPPGQVMPFAARHPHITATGKTAYDLPGQVGTLGQELVSGATLGGSKRAGDAGAWLSHKLFGAEDVRKKDKKIPTYMKAGANVIGSMATIGGMGKVIATPTIQLVAKSKYLAPFASMIGWGATGVTYESLSTMIEEGELPTPKELAKHGARWSLLAGTISSLGWLGRLAIGTKRLSRLWNIPQKEVLKTVIAEAKAKKMPIAKFVFTKSKVQKALSVKGAEGADKFLNYVNGLSARFTRRGTYADLVNQLKDQEIESRIKMFKKHVGAAELIGKKPQPKKIIVKKPGEIEQILQKPAFGRTAEEVALLNKAKSKLTVVGSAEKGRVAPVHMRPLTHIKKKVLPSPWKKMEKPILKEELPGWIKRTGDDIRIGRFVSKKKLQEYKDFFKDRVSSYMPVTKKYPVAKVLSKPTKTSKVTLESPWGKRGPRVLKENLPLWVQKIGKDIRYGRPVSKMILRKYKEYFRKRTSLYDPKMVEPKPVPKTKVVKQTTKAVVKTKIELKKDATVPAATGKLLAALKYPNGKIVTGHSHLQCLELAEKKGLDKLLLKGSARPLKEGFVDSRGNFLSRDEATRAFGAGESFVLKQRGVIGEKIDTRPVAKLLRKKIANYHQRRYSDEGIQVKLRGEGFKEADIVTAIVKAKHAKPGIRLGFGPVGELQRIYEKLAGFKWRKHPKVKIGDVVEKPVNKEVELLLKAIRGSKIKRAEQDILYKKARGARLAKAQAIGKVTSGQAGFEAEKAALGGKLPQVEFQPISKRMGQAAIDSLFDQVKHCPTLNVWERYPANKALGQIFGEYGGTVPAPSGLKLLEEVFGKKLVKALTAIKPRDWKNITMDTINIPKALRASFDVSAGLRQGLFLIGRPKRWIPAMASQFKYLVSPKAFSAAQKEIAERPMYRLMMKSKLSLTDLGSLSKREEAFQSTLAEYVPGVKASSRAFTGMLNQLRAGVFEDIAKKGIRLGIKDPKYFKDLAKYINHATGRGDLLKLEHLAVELNTVFFSPRLIMSRLQLLNPVFYKNLHPQVRKEALRDLFTVASTALTVTGLAKLSGLSVETDPRNADFLKIKKGNLRYDILGGFQQPVRAAAQFITGTYINSITGQPETLGEGYKPMTRLGIASKFLKGKLSPVAAFCAKLMGEKQTSEGLLDIPTELGTLVAPMAMADLFDLYDEHGQEGIPMAIPAFLGVGVQTYGGVATYDLSGKDYPTINKELNRLKMSMGFPSLTAYSQQLSAREYHAYKARAGKKIVNELGRLLKAPYYQQAPDGAKKEIIEKNIIQSKEEIKHRLFPRKRHIATRATRIKNRKHVTREEAIELAKKQLRK